MDLQCNSLGQIWRFTKVQVSSQMQEQYSLTQAFMHFATSFQDSMKTFIYFCYRHFKNQSGIFIFYKKATTFHVNVIASLDIFLYISLYLIHDGLLK